MRIYWRQIRSMQIYWRRNDYEKTIIVIITCVCIAASANAQQGSGRLSLGTGLLYKNGMDITLAYEHEMNYRHMWEFFVNGYLQWAECASCGHICPESFWRNYRSYGLAWPTSRA